MIISWSYESIAMSGTVKLEILQPLGGSVYLSKGDISRAKLKAAKEKLRKLREDEAAAKTDRGREEIARKGQENREEGLRPLMVDGVDRDRRKGRPEGIEPSLSRPQREVLPLNYGRHARRRIAPPGWIELAKNTTPDQRRHGRQRGFARRGRPT